MGRNVASTQQSDAQGTQHGVAREQSVTERVQFGKSKARKPKPLQVATDLTVKTLLAKGGSIRQVAAVLGCSPTTIQRIKDRLSAQGEDLKSGLMSPVRDENAGKLIDHFIGKGLKMRTVKGSDALGAVKMYADRRWPVRTEAAPPSRSFVVTNLNIFLPDSQPAAVDVTPTTTRGVLEDGKETREKNLNQFNTCNVRL
jgi:hypothetical protein